MKIRLVFFVLAVFCLFHVAVGQQCVGLSKAHEEKLYRNFSGHKRLLRYYKYFRRDSIQFIEGQNRRHKKRLDSLWTEEKKIRRREKDRANSGLAEDSILFKRIGEWSALKKETNISDSVKEMTRDELRQLVLEKGKQHPGFQIALEQYQLGNDSLTWDDLTKQAPGLDTLSELFNSSPDELCTAAAKSVEHYFSGESSMTKLKEGNRYLNQLKSLRTGYEQQYKQYTDKEALEQHGKDKVSEKALDYFADHEKELGAAQKKVSKLLGKYREFTNSENLEDAVKHTSMKGKTFKEHLVLGGNFNVISTEPVSIDVSPQVGYKITTKFFVALGMSYRLSFRDSIRNSKYVSPHNTSFELSTSYDLIKSFYAYAEWKKSGIKINSEPTTYRWMDNYFIGIGKRFLVHPKVYLTLTALYNLNNTDNNPAYPKRFQIRVGFQLSELATRKKKIYYDPNR